MTRATRGMFGSPEEAAVSIRATRRRAELIALDAERTFAHSQPGALLLEHLEREFVFASAWPSERARTDGGMDGMTLALYQARRDGMREIVLYLRDILAKAREPAEVTDE